MNYVRLYNVSISLSDSIRNSVWFQCLFHTIQPNGSGWWFIAPGKMINPFEGVSWYTTDCTYPLTIVSCQKCFARHVLQDWEWSKGAPQRRTKTSRNVMGITNTDTFEWYAHGRRFFNYNFRLDRIVRSPHSEDVLAKQAKRKLLAC